jgi:uncharacterized protein with NAD-binding domain and iron-sulfur cluster
MPADRAQDGRRFPGEHGFRFFPGFYRHVVDTMARIPLGDGRSVAENLTQSTRVEIAGAGGAPALVLPAQFPRSVREWGMPLRVGWEYCTQLGIPVRDQLHFLGLLCKLLGACDERRFSEYKNESWWDFAGAQQRSQGYRTYLANGFESLRARQTKSAGHGLAMAATLSESTGFANSCNGRRGI